MHFSMRAPCVALRPYVRCLWWLDSAEVLTSVNSLFPTGSMELVFNLGQVTLQSLVEGKPVATPRTELLGQITQPYSVRVVGRNVLGGALSSAYRGPVLPKLRHAVYGLHH